MYYVNLKQPLPGVRSTTFVFYTLEEASEFASCIHARFPDAQTEEGKAGEPTEVFEHWSF